MRKSQGVCLHSRCSSQSTSLIISKQSASWKKRSRLPKRRSKKWLITSVCRKSCLISWSRRSRTRKPSRRSWKCACRSRRRGRTDCRSSWWIMRRWACKESRSLKMSRRGSSWWAQSGIENSDKISNHRRKTSTRSLWWNSSDRSS